MKRPTYYEVLGVPPGATQEQIRKRYRALVRQYHPDVNPSPHAQEQFIQIQEAYQVLIDPERRRHYDALLAMERQKTGSRDQGSGVRGQGIRSEPRTPNPGTRNLSEAQRLLQEAEMAFIRGRLRDAMMYARQVLKLNPRNAMAHMILGDVYRVQGQVEAALNAYTIALQLDPHNITLLRKLERLASSPRAADRVQPARRSGGTWLPALRLSAEFLRNAVQALGWSGALLLMVLPRLAPGEPVAFLSTVLPMVESWSLNLMLFLFLDGLLAGVLLAASGWVALLEDVLPWRMRRRRFSAGVGLVLTASLCFPVAGLMYALLGVLQNAFNRSLNRAFLTAGSLTLGFTLAYPGQPLQTLLFGGNLLFIGLLCGWLLTDAFRSEGNLI